MLKLNLNEACKLAKNMEEYKNILTALLVNNDYVYDIKENHLKNKTNPEAEDEVIDPTDGCEKYDVEINDILQILDKLTLEKAKLANLIENAKHNILIDVNDIKLSLDCAIEYNKSLRNEIYYISRMNRYKDSKIKSTGKDFKFDNELKQTPYVYTVEIDKKLKFSTKETKLKEKELRKLADTISVKIEKSKIETELEIETALELNDSIEDFIEKLKN